LSLPVACRLLQAAVKLSQISPPADGQIYNLPPPPSRRGPQGRVINL